MENRPTHDNSKVILALVIIVIGMLWLVRKLGVHFHIPDFQLEPLFYPLRNIFHGWGSFIFSWPMILIVVGLILMAGKRQAGLVLLIIGGIFILPKLFFIPGLTISLLLPLLLIGVGVAMVARLF